MGIISRWSRRIAERNKAELLSNRLYSPFGDDAFYREFLKECKASGLTLDDAEEMWYIANREANDIDV